MGVDSVQKLVCTAGHLATSQYEVATHIPRLMSDLTLDKVM